MNYILYGEQYPMIRKRLAKILKERLGEPDDFNVVKIDFEESSIDELIQECSLLPLGCERKAVVVDNAHFLEKGTDEKEIEKFSNCLKNSIDEIDTIFILRSEKIDTKSPIVAQIKNENVFKFLNLSKEEWPLYAEKFFKERSVQIDRNAIEELINRINGDLLRFTNESEKLCLYSNHITLNDVKLMISRPLENDVFQISNALFRGQNQKAVSIYRDLKLLGSKSIDTIIPLLATQFRFISQACYLDSLGLSQKEIASELNAQDFRVMMALKNSRFLTKKQISGAIEDLYNLDYQIKSGQIDRFYGFELFLINFPN